MKVTGKVRPCTLWKVPVYCMAAGLVTFFLTLHFGALFFARQELAADGSATIGLDPIRAAIFHAVLFLLVLLLGGFLVCRSMTKREVICSAAILAVLHLVVVLVQLFLPSAQLQSSLVLAALGNWFGDAYSLLYAIVPSHLPAALLSCLCPFLFVPFGRKASAPK